MFGIGLVQLLESLQLCDRIMFLKKPLEIYPSTRQFEDTVNYRVFDMLY